VMARSSLWREESRGCHARADCPEPRTEFAVHDLWKRGTPTPRTTPVRS